MDIYKATQRYPKEELYGLSSQMRRAAVSIPSNIAEGSGRDHNAEFAYFLRISMGSSTELEYQLILARDLEYLAEADYQRLTEDLISVKKMLNKFIQSLTANSQ